MAVESYVLRDCWKLRCCTARLAECAAWLAIFAILFSVYERGRSNASISLEVPALLESWGKRREALELCRVENETLLVCDVSELESRLR